MNTIRARSETWGNISYDVAKDEFSAEIKAGHDPLPESPLGLGWVIIGNCNLKCIMCYGNAEALPTTVLSTQDALRIADAIVAAQVMRVVISGGEPLLRDDIFQIIRYLRARGTNVILGTNGAFITEENVAELTACGRVELSLDAATSELNNRIRPSRQRRGNAWHETLSGIKLCLDHGVNCRVITTVNSLNQTELPQIASLLYNMGICDWAVSWTIPAGRAYPIYSSLRPDRHVVEEMIESAGKLFPSLTIRYSNRGPEYNRFYALILPDGQFGTEDIGAGTKIPFGSLLNTPISSVWNETNFDISAHFRKWVGDRRSNLKTQRYE